MPDEVKSYVGQKGAPQAEFFHLDAEVGGFGLISDPRYTILLVTNRYSTGVV
jgi:hypothetical protein